MLIAAGVYYHFVYIPESAPRGEAAYVLPRSVEVVDTTAQIRNVIAHLKAGDRVQVIGQTAHWSELEMPHGETGWVETKYLLDAATYQRGEALLKGLEDCPPQAVGHTSTVTNLHLAPARDSIALGELAENQRLEIFARRVVERPAGDVIPAAAGARPHDVWYLVRAHPRAGWVLGRFVDLDVPAGIGAYAQGINIVGWLVLKTVQDGGQAVPEYLVADRIGAEDVDFNHIRVFNWWLKHHKYVTAYVESNLSGYFPMQTKQVTDASFYAQPSPYFRLRLASADGHHYQKVYGLFDTIVRAVGTVDGWDSQAMPVPAPREKGAHREQARSARHAGRR